jgi:hypothetical protein
LVIRYSVNFEALDGNSEFPKIDLPIIEFPN